jgi:diguanylate cyclase (GGDEF)-like protein/PAS domain S-box-containing protein
MSKLSLDTKVFLLGALFALLFALLTQLLHLGGTQKTSSGVFLLAASLLAGLGMFVWFIHHYVTRRIITMAHAVTRLADGDDGRTLVPALGEDEIGVLAEKFNQLLSRNRQMTRDLEHLVDIKSGELYKANEALLLAGQVFENVIDAIIITDPEGVILRANPAFAAVTGFAVGETVGRKANLVKSDRHPREFYTEMWRQLKAAGSWRGEIWNRRKNGEVFPAMLSITSVRDEGGNITHYVGTIDDISLNKSNEERIRYLAFHDPLTGLANRVLFADRTATGLQRAKREGYSLAIVVLDLDGFKEVNDSYGHAAGDQLLIEIARRLQGVLRAEDTVARFGGDEFTALLPEVVDPQDAVIVAQKILATVAVPVTIRGSQVRVSASIGISIYPTHGEDYQALFTAADTAMYQVKAAGKAGVRLASAEP